jgi:hypothetical protein
LLVDDEHAVRAQHLEPVADAIHGPDPVSRDVENLRDWPLRRESGARRLGGRGGSGKDVGAGGRAARQSVVGDIGVRDAHVCAASSSCNPL